MIQKKTIYTLLNLFHSSAPNKPNIHHRVSSLCTVSNFKHTPIKSENIKCYNKVFKITNNKSRRTWLHSKYWFYSRRSTRVELQRIGYGPKICRLVCTLLVSFSVSPKAGLKLSTQIAIYIYVTNTSRFVLSSSIRESRDETFDTDQNTASILCHSPRW